MPIWLSWDPPTVTSYGAMLQQVDAATLMLALLDSHWPGNLVSALPASGCHFWRSILFLVLSDTV